LAEILVSGYYGFNNAGDEAILGGIITAFRAIDPTVRFTVISGKVVRTRAVHGVEAVSRGDVRAILKAMSRANLLLSGGGSLLQDVTGMKSIPYYLGVTTLGKLSGLPVMFYAQGVGPVRRAVNRTLISVLGGLAVDQATVRDQESAEALRELGLGRKPITVTADPALALPVPSRAAGLAILDQQGIKPHGPLIGVAIRPWKLADARMLQALALALDEVAAETGGTILFVPMQYPQDVAAARDVAALMRRTPVLFEAHVPYCDTQAVIAACDLMVGMRYHSLVFAAMAGVPTVGLSYDQKNDNFLRLLDQQAVGTPQDLDAARLRAAILDGLANQQTIAARYSNVMERLVPLAHQNAVIAWELMKRWQSK
jgi:polysaccharide pyruvyl transferase CsaB